MSQFRRITMSAVVLVLMLATDSRGQRLLEIDGVELYGEARLLQPGGGTCNVLESDTSYESRKEHDGAPMDIWRLDFTVRNRSGRWLDHLIAQFRIASGYPECTNWDVPDSAELLVQYSIVEAGGSIGFIQESGRNVVSPGQSLTDTTLVIVLRGDLEPHFSSWYMDVDFAVNPPPASTAAGTPSRPAPDRQPVAATPEQEALFWESIMDSTNPAEFAAYLSQFPNGVFRALAEARLETLLATPPSSVAAEVVDFGDDTGDYAQDGECDDPRFQGPGMGLTGSESHRGRDATDCRQLFDSGRVSLKSADGDVAEQDHGPGCSRERLIGLGVLTSQLSRAVPSTIQFTGSRMVMINRPAPGAELRMESEYEVSADAITYRIVRAVGTIPGSGTSDQPPIRNPGPHTVACSLSGGVLSFGNGTWR